MTGSRLGAPAGPGTGLDALRALLLRDTDGDGAPDALVGPVWIARGGGPDDVDAAVAAAAELLTALADRAFVLRVETRAWDAREPGFSIGSPTPPVETGHASMPAAEGPLGVRLSSVGGTVSVTGPQGAHLSAAVVAWLDELREEEPVPERAARSASEARSASDAPGASSEDAARGGSLGSLLAGGGPHQGQSGLYTGSRDHAECFVGGFAPVGGAEDALAVALRLALNGTRTPERCTAPREHAGARTTIDPTTPTGTWTVRTPPAGSSGSLEIVAGDSITLGAACRWFAADFPRLPGGSWLADVEDALTRFVRAETRDGRIAAAASAARLQRHAGDEPVRAEAPYPPADAARLLGLPIRNSARSGPLRRWSRSTPWEGERLLAAAAELADRAREGAGAVTIEAYASESLDVRLALSLRLRTVFETAGIEVQELRVRHAFRPALHWLLEEITPSLPPECATLRVLMSRQPASLGAPDRWLRELYPVAELIEASRPGLHVAFEFGPERREPLYLALLLDEYGRLLREAALEPPVSDSPLTDGGVALATTGGLRVRRADAVVAERIVRTDADAFWHWFVQEVLPQVTAAGAGAHESLWHELAIVAELSEPDDRLPIDHETDSVLESLHEDVYFGVLEAAVHQFGEAPPRSLSPGRVLPFFRGRAGAPMRAQVVARAAGSERVGVQAASGAWREAPPCRADVRVVEVRGRADHPHELVVEISPDAEEAMHRLTWAARLRPALLPGGLTMIVRAAGARDAPVRLGPFAPPPEPAALPARPLHPREAVAHARALAARHPSMHVALPRESCLGRPLCVIEVGMPCGPAASRARLAAWRPSVLLSARQHANEPTSTQAAFAWLERVLCDGELSKRANLIVHPLENPDGARLHAALCALAPNHMHHAARYTAFGADLQTDPRVGGRVIDESLMRHDAAERWHPVLHLNDHGYPAHAWLRAHTGFVPRGFEDWSLPTGHLTILSTHEGSEADAAALREAVIADVERALLADDGVRDHTRAQAQRSSRYRPVANTPFDYRSGLPFWSNHRPRSPIEPTPGGSEPDGARERSRMAPWLTLITEVPDETVSGEAWHACVRTHIAVNEAVARRFLAWWRDAEDDDDARGEPIGSPGA